MSMTEAFTARTGRTVAIKSRSMTGTVLEISGLGTRTTVDLGDVETLREFFLHERDKELGRWRWHEKPDYVVYPSDLYLTPPNFDLVTVFNERTGQSSHCRREDDGNCGHFSFAARAYFAAHQEPKPWHDAKPGEVWLVSTVGVHEIPSGEPLPMQVMLDDSGQLETRFFVHWNGPDAETVDVESRVIESAHRVYPEMSDA